MSGFHCSFEKQCFGHDSTPEMSYFTTTLSFIFLILNIPGNFLVIVAVALNPNKNLRTPFNLLMTNLAVADLVVGTVTQPMAIYIHWNEADSNHATLEQLSGLHMSYFISCTASLLSLGTLAVERYLAIRSVKAIKNICNIQSFKIIVTRGPTSPTPPSSARVEH